MRVDKAIGGIVLAATLATPAAAQRSVVDSVHNLSAGGPGEIRAAAEQQVCIFCHTPHRSAPVLPLWNRDDSLLAYTPYTSSALDAEPGQPTGPSKMCLSCHDGSIALGSVLSRDQVIEMAAGITSLSPGSASNLGTDLSDDHPISFRFDTALASQDQNLANPWTLPEHVGLDSGGELQCTTCHDAHDNSFGKFLVMDNMDSRLCTTCHRIADTNIRAHENCRACHRTHSAPSGPFLLVEENVTATCLSCHDGSVTGADDVAADLQKFSVHSTSGPVDPVADSGHTTCTDCHDPHTMLSGPSAFAPNVAAALGQPRGEAGAGGTQQATYEYQVCFRCHGDLTTVRRGRIISRQVVQPSTRLQFDPSNPSYHPVVAPGRNVEAPSLRPGWTSGSLVLCSDCHGSDNSRKAGGSGPNGVHGSMFHPLLLARYETIDRTPESSDAYALCYRCHERDGVGGILRDTSFPHSLHVVDSRATCSTCHDAHGISSAQGSIINNSHLINFDTSRVFPDPVSGRLEFTDRGRFSGSCTLTCHGFTHQATEYNGGLSLSP